MTFETYFLYLLAVGAFFLTPPDTSQLLMASNSLSHGLRQSVFTVMGDLSANTLQIIATALGIGAVVKSYPGIFTTIQWLGVLYLMWIGFQVLRTSPFNVEGGIVNKTSRGKLFQTAFFTSVANPYAIIFFAALMPQFVDVDRPIGIQFGILGFTYIMVDGLILILWGVIAIHGFQKINTVTNSGINRISGLFMIAAAILLALKDFKTYSG